MTSRCGLTVRVLIAVMVMGSSFAVEITVKRKPRDCAQTARVGDKVYLHYKGYVKSDMTMFEDSRALWGEERPFPFQIGDGSVIAEIGWDIGVEGMCVGERRRLEIPPFEAYGAEGSAPVIPPNADLIFDVELVDLIQPKSDWQLEVRHLLFLGLGVIVLALVGLCFVVPKESGKQPTSVSSAKGERVKKED